MSTPYDDNCARIFLRRQDVTRGTIEERLVARRKIDPTTGCWEWTGRPCGGGYCQVMIGRQRHRVHRLAAAVWLGFDIDSPLLVCHDCDNRTCFNPDHLFIGTHADNHKDMCDKGRQGSAQHAPERFGKLTPEDVRQIRHALASGESLRSVGRRFGVSHEAVRMIRDGRTWNNL
jgi:hypothetical protein